MVVSASQLAHWTMKQPPSFLLGHCSDWDSLYRQVVAACLGSHALGIPFPFAPIVRRIRLFAARMEGRSLSLSEGWCCLHGAKLFSGDSSDPPLDDSVVVVQGDTIRTHKSSLTHFNPRN